MTYYELIKKLSEETSLEEGDIRRVLDSFAKTVGSLEEGIIQIPMFGVFQTVEKKIRKRDSEKVIRTLKFIPARAIKKELVI